MIGVDFHSVCQLIVINMEQSHLTKFNEVEEEKDETKKP